MKFVLALALLSHQEPATSVVGLLDGERAWSSDPKPRLLALLEPSESRIPLAMGRLVDGCTGEPISGARVEVFLEDFWGPLDAPPTVGRGSEVATATNEDDSASGVIGSPRAIGSEIIRTSRRSAARPNPHKMIAAVKTAAPTAAASHGVRMRRVGPGTRPPWRL